MSRPAAWVALGLPEPIRLPGEDAAALQRQGPGQAEPGRGCRGAGGLGIVSARGLGDGPGGTASSSASGRLGSGSERLPSGPGCPSSSACCLKGPGPAGRETQGAPGERGHPPQSSPGLAGGGNLMFTPGQGGSGRARPRSAPGRAAPAGSASPRLQVDRRFWLSHSIQPGPLLSALHPVHAGDRTFLSRETD